VIAVILSWIFDIGPEGIEKTKPASKLKSDDKLTVSNSWKIASYLSFVVIIALVLFHILSSDNTSKEIANLEKSIAVLPFSNLSEEEGNEYFIDGLVDDLLNRISVIDRLKVISHTSSDMYRERGVKSIPQIAEELGVTFILEGSVQRYGNKARITVQLIDAKNDDHIWADKYDRDLVDVFQTQSEIAMQVASELNTILTSNEMTQIQESKTENVKAFELYQMGRFYWNKRTGDGYARSIEYFEQAINEDPGYGLAYAGLADTYNLMALQGWIEQQEGRDKAVELALKALELDGNLAEAYTVLGSIYDYVDWDWDNAERAFKRAFEINPNYATAHHYYSQHCHITGRNEEAWIHINKALELNPLSFVIRYVSGAEMYYNDGRFAKALEEIQKCNELHANHPWLPRSEFAIYWQLGQEEKAFEALRKVLKQDPVYNLQEAEEIYKKSGLRAVIDFKLKADSMHAEGSRAYYIADTYGMMGEDEKAMDWLELANKMNMFSPHVSFNIHFKNAHHSPEYLAILEKMGLASQ
jgi:TolB-like protein